MWNFLELFENQILGWEQAQSKVQAVNKKKFEELTIRIGVIRRSNEKACISRLNTPAL